MPRGGELGVAVSPASPRCPPPVRRAAHGVCTELSSPRAVFNKDVIVPSPPPRCYHMSFINLCVLIFK